MFDEAGHRVATQYLFSVLRGHMPAEKLLKYRHGHSSLPGHPELGRTPGIEFSSGRLGHLWGHLNGVSRAQPEKIVCCLGSDGSQMEGNNAEAARFAVANGLPVKLFIDDNDVTISGHPSQYLTGSFGRMDIESTLDEFNAYTHHLYGDYAFVDRRSSGSRSASRDGMVCFMLYLEIYLHLTRTNYPDQWALMRNDTTLRQLIWTTPTSPTHLRPRPVASSLCTRIGFSA